MAEPTPNPTFEDIDLEATSRLSELEPESEFDDPVAHFHDDFVEQVKKGSFDFSGSHDDATELDQNAYYQQLDQAFAQFLTVNNNPDVPQKFSNKWMQAAEDFMVNEIAAYDWKSGEIGQKEVDEIIVALITPNKAAPKSGKPGIGKLEEWIQNQPALKREYDKWKKDHAVASAEAQKGDARSRLQELRLETDNPSQHYMDQFVSRVKTGAFNFGGEHNNEAELEQNVHFSQLVSTLERFLQVHDNPELPTNIRGAWMKACIDFLTGEITAYNTNPPPPSVNPPFANPEYGQFGIGKKDVDEMRKALITPGKRGPITGKPGIGRLEEWIHNQPEWKGEYEKWEKTKAAQKAQEEAAAKAAAAAAEASKTEAQRAEDARLAELRAQQETEQGRQTAAQEAAQNLATTKEQLVQRDTELDTQFLALPPTIVSASLATRIAAMKTDIAAMNNAAQEGPLKTRIGKLESEISAFENLWSMSGDPDIPTAARDKVFKAVKDGTQTPQDGWAELQKAQTAKRAADERALAEDGPPADKWIASIEKMKPGALRTLATMAVSVVVSLSKAPLIGSYFRKLFSNKYLWEKYGDEDAHKSYDVEQEFRKFGIKRSVCAALGDMPTKDAVTELETNAEAYAPNDASGKVKLEWLATQLRAKGGDTSEATLYEFMGSPDWLPVKYRADQAPAVVQNAPAPRPTPAPAPPGAQPQAAPAGTPPVTIVAAPAAAAAAAGTANEGAKDAQAPTPAELETQYAAALNKSLERYKDKPPFDLTAGQFPFELPYKNNGKVEKIPCKIYGNTFEIGSYKYNLKLPMGANLQSISISGSVEDGKVKLVAGALMITGEREISLSKLVEHLEALRVGPASHQIPLGTETATFEKVA
ncbi:MAG: hypothetical protein AAB588_05110 [Patescibacteria group bacterium]